MAAATPAGPPPMMVTSCCSSCSAAAAALIKSGYCCCSFSMSLAVSILPLAKGLPFKYTAGTPWILRSLIMSWNTPPSIISLLMLSLSNANWFSACTTSGQLWQDNETNVSNFSGCLIALMIFWIPGSSLSSLPPDCKIAKINEVNSWPPGIPLKMIPVSLSWLRILKLIGDRLASNCWLKRILSVVPAIWVKKSTSSARCSCSPSPNTNSIGRVIRSL